MSKKIFSILGGSVLAAFLLVGCNVKQEPPPPEDEAPMEENDNMGENGDMNDGDMGEEHYPESEDKNVQGDKDAAKDNNTPEEDVIEDDIDMKDKDNKDE